MEFKQKEQYDVDDLLSIMELLRSPEGCPWDREQTHKSIRRNMLEEACEAMEAIDLCDPALLKEELGDVLLQVVFHARIEEESGSFNFADVCDGICKKLILRHPHIFSDVKADTSDQVLRNWDEIKKAEKGHKSLADDLKSVSKALPALMRAEKVQGKAAKSGFCLKSSNNALDDVRDELEELSEAILSEDSNRISGELGDVLFAAANLSRHLGLDPEECLGHSTQRFIYRFSEVEKLALEKGIPFENLENELLDNLWQEVKNMDYNI